MSVTDDPACCGSTHGCVFAKALMAQRAQCGHSQRRMAGEWLSVDCADATAHGQCAGFRDALRERARFALKLPTGGRPLMHTQALRLQCGGLSALAQWLGHAQADVHELLHLAKTRSVDGAGAGADARAGAQTGMIGDDGRDTSCDAARATRGATPQTMVSPDAATQFADLPWAQLVPQVAAWQPQRRRRTPMQHPGEDADAPPPDRLPPNPFGDPS